MKKGDFKVNLCFSVANNVRDALLQTSLPLILERHSSIRLFRYLELLKPYCVMFTILIMINNLKEALTNIILLYADFGEQQHC